MKQIKEAYLSKDGTICYIGVQSEYFNIISNFIKKLINNYDVISRDRLYGKFIVFELTTQIARAYQSTKDSALEYMDDNKVLIVVE